MIFRIIQPTEALRPYITRYVCVRAEGSTDTMAPPENDPHFVNGKHVQELLPNYGSFVFMRNVLTDIEDVPSDGLTLLGANQRTIGLTTVSGWFDGMLLDFEPGGMYALLGIDLQPHKEDINYTRLRKVIAACDGARGNISAAQMASVACLGERQFLRIFRNYVGISPKQFIRLQRFHKAIQYMQQQTAAGKTIDLMQVALQHGYYDLSHMAMEFQQMGCVSPSHFRMLGIPLTADFSVFFA